MLGASLALLSAAMFGMNVASLRRGVLAGSVLQALAVTVPLGVPLFAVACLIAGAFGALGEMSLSAWGWMSAAGIVHFVIGRYGNYRATRALGSTQSSPIVQMSLPVSLVLAIIYLGESLTPLRVLGIILIMLGPMIILRQHAAKGEVRTKSGLKLNYLEGYFWGLVCAIGFGTSPLLIRLGLEGGGVLPSLAGGLVSYVAATLVVTLLLFIPGNLRHVRALDAGASRWFGAAAVLVFFSQMFLYMALALAPISVVMPIQRTTAVFRVVFGWMLNRQHEVLGGPVIFGVLLSIIGVFAVTISIEQLLEFVSLPPSILGFARLQWP